MKPIYSLAVFACLTQGIFTGGRFLVALYAANQQASTLVIGVLISLFSLAPTFGSVPAGRIADRVGTRWPMLTCMTLLTLGMCLPLVLPGVMPLFVTAPLVGGAYFALYLCTNTLANSLSSKSDRAANFARLSVGVSSGQALGPLCAGLLIDHHSHAAAFVLMAILPLASHVWFVLLGLQHTPSKPQKESDHSRGALDLLRFHNLRPVLFLSTMFILAADVFVVMVPIYGLQLRLSASEMGMIASAFSVASFSVRAMSARLVDYFTIWQLMIMALVLAGTGIMLIGAVTTLPLLMLFAFASGLGQGLGAPMSTSAVYEVAPPEHASEAMGLRLSLGMATQVVLPIIIGSIGAFLTAEPVFYVCGLMLIGAAATQHRQWRRKTVEQPGE